MKEQKIEFKEIDSNHLGSEKEYKTPTEKANASSTSNSGKS